MLTSSPPPADGSEEGRRRNTRQEPQGRDRQDVVGPQVARDARVVRLEQQVGTGAQVRPDGPGHQLQTLEREGQLSSRARGRSPTASLIDVKPISKPKWKSIASSMAARAVFVSKLLAGEMPADVEDVFSRSSVTLFPGKREIRTDCSCPDHANPCKHVAAVDYILAEEFDREPFMMFLLRGETRDDLMASLRDGRRLAAVGEGAGASRGSAKAADVPAPAPPPLEDSVAVFWIEQKPLGGIVVAPRRPQVDAAVIKRLGEPPFWREPEDFTEVMEQVYGAVTSKAMKVAFG